MRSGRDRLLLLALVATWPAFVATAQPPPAPPASVTAPNRPTISLTGQLDLARLVDLASARFSLAIDYDPALLRQQQVTVRSSAAATDADLWLLTNQVLAQRGFTIVRPVGGIGLTVVKLEDAPRSAKLEPTLDLNQPPAPAEPAPIDDVVPPAESLGHLWSLQR